MNDYKKIYVSALGLLSRREHSDLELQRKLFFRFPGQNDAITQVIAALKQEGALSRQRYVESYVHRRAARGIGPVRILQELSQIHVTLGEINHAAAQAGVDWHVLAGEVAAKRKSRSSCETFRDQIKLKTFLRYRGFTTEQIKSLDFD